MCIRDSTWTGSAFEVIGEFASSSIPVIADLDGDGKLEVITVSYTHLRAHETVLDIVCRLLLEKKKTHSTNTIHTMNTSKLNNDINTKKLEHVY